MCSICHEAGVAVVPYGTGTGLEGGTLALRGGLAVNLTRMDQVGLVEAMVELPWSIR